MEGRHFGVGPWFTVQKEQEWKNLGKFLMSNGSRSIWARLEVRLDFAAPNIDGIPVQLSKFE